MLIGFHARACSERYKRIGEDVDLGACYRV